jgi:FtsH-binding integral membrane protein
MFTTKRLVTITLRSTLRGSRLTPKQSFTAPLASSINLVSTISRGYATHRRGGASSRPVQVKERPAATNSANSVAPRVEEAPMSHEQQQETYPYQQYYGQQASDVINQSVSLQSFLKRSMITTGAGIGVTAVATVGFMQIPFVLMHPYVAMIGGAVATIGSLIGMSYVRPTYVQEGEILKAVNSPQRQALFGTFVVAEGLTLAPMLKMVALTAPMAIPVAASLALGTMAGMVAYALKQPQGSLAKYGPALYVGVMGLIATGIVNMFVHSSALSFAMSAVSIGIFSAFTAYDTHQAIDEHNNGQPDHLLTAANFFINFINLFLDYLRLIRSFFSD